MIPPGLNGARSPRAFRMAEFRAWSNLLFRARLLRAHDAAAPSRASRTMLEAYIDGDTAVIFECAQPVSRAVLSNIRAILSDSGGVLAAAGALAFRFNYVGRLGFAPGANKRDISAHSRLAEAIVIHADTCVEVLTDPNELGAVEAQLARKGLRADLRGVLYRPWQLAAPSNSTAAAAGLLALAALEGILSLYTDAVFTDEVLAQV